MEGAGEDLDVEIGRDERDLGGVGVVERVGAEEGHGRSLATADPPGGCELAIEVRRLSW